MRILTAPLFTLLLITGVTGNVLAQENSWPYVLLPFIEGSAGFSSSEEVLFYYGPAASGKISSLGPTTFTINISNTGDVPQSSTNNSCAAMFEAEVNFNLTAVTNHLASKVVEEDNQRFLVVGDQKFKLPDCFANATSFFIALGLPLTHEMAERIALDPQGFARGLQPQFIGARIVDIPTRATRGTISPGRFFYPPVYNYY